MINVMIKLCNLQQIAVGKHYCISLTKPVLNVEIGVMVKCNINIVLNLCNM